MKMILASLVFLAAVLSASADDRTGQPEALTVDRQGRFCNSNVVANVADFAAAKAQEKITEEAANAAHNVATNCERIVDEGIAEVQRGAKIEYSCGFMWSVGAFQISSNAACNISKFVMQQSMRKTIDNVQHFACDIFENVESLADFIMSLRSDTCAISAGLTAGFSANRTIR